MVSLKKELESKLAQAKRVAILGVGSDLRGDDAAGILVADLFSKRSPKTRLGPRCKVFIGATAPENLTGQIKKFKPTHLVIIDSAELGSVAGKVRLIGTEELVGASFYTHKLPLKIMIEYLAKSLNCETIVIGIQPKSLSFCSSPTKPVVTAIKQVSGALKEILER
jgi:hydrogenase 3 maturation protease